MKYYDKMHYEEELDLFCSCIRASISIMLHKTIYEINITLLLRTHFKPPSSVCNNFLLRSHVEFGHILSILIDFPTCLSTCICIPLCTWSAQTGYVISAFTYDMYGGDCREGGTFNFSAIRLKLAFSISLLHL